MTDQEINRELDVWRDRMVAALYGELPPEEEEEFLTQLAHDPVLRAEWDELQESRGFLRAAEQEAADTDPGFVFQLPAAAGAGDAAGRKRERARGWWVSLLARPAAGFALAAAAAVILMFAGLRIDRVSGGLAVHFGPAAPTVPALAGLEPEATSAGDPDLNAPVTRGELVAFAQQLVSATETRLEQQQDRYLGQTVYLLRDYHRAAEEDRLRDRRQITSEMNRALLALLQAGAWDGERLEIPRGQATGDSTPAAAPRTLSEEGVRHE